VLHPLAALATIVAAAALLALVFAVRATHWAVMTDELQTAKLATSIAATLSPVPHIHGVYFPALSQLYPLLMAPFFGTLRPPAAATAVHALNGFLLASAAIPAYLLARSVTGSRPAAIVAAAMTAFTPWLVLSATLLTENAAYPAFVWAVFLCYRAMAAPSFANDLAACAGLVLAFFARTQMIVLAFAFPIAVVAHEVAFALGGAESGTRLGAALDALRRIVSRHPLLAVVYAGGGALVAVLAAGRSLDTLLGTYGGAVHGRLIPNGLWGSAITHLDHVVTGVGVVPFLLAAAWAFTAVLRPERKQAHAFAVLSIVVVPLLTLEVTSFDLRYAGHFEQDRYLFYVVPLLAVGAVAALTQRTQAVARVALLLVAAGAFVGADVFVSYHDRLPIWFAAPAAAFHPTLAEIGRALGLPAGTFVRLVVAVVAVMFAAAILRGPKIAAVWACGLAVAAFGAFEAAWEFHRYVVPSLTVRSTVADRNWIDAAAGSSSVALVPSPWVPAPAWWEAEFWNKNVDRVVRVGRRSTYTPFPATPMDVDFAAGRLRGPATPGLLVLARHEARFSLAGTTPVATTNALSLVRVRPPLRLRWATQGAGTDGWIRPGDRATVRIFGGNAPIRRRVTVTTTAPIPARASHSFTFESGRSKVRTPLGPGGRISVELAACVPPHGFVDATVGARFATRITDGRLVALHVDEIRERPAPRAARCGSLHVVGG
jgi:hypothetical protein